MTMGGGSERQEGRKPAGGKILRCAQNDNGGEAQNDNGGEARNDNGGNAVILRSGFPSLCHSEERFSPLLSF